MNAPLSPADNSSSKEAEKMETSVSTVRDQRGKGPSVDTPIAPDDIVFISPALIAASSFGGDGKYFQVATSAGKEPGRFSRFCWSCAVGEVFLSKGKYSHAGPEP